jgi:hypothetical protein
MSYRRSRIAPLRGVVLVAFLATSAFLTLAGGLTANAAAPASTLPTVTIAISPSSITVGGALQSGAVNIVSTATGVKEAGAILFLLKPGVSVAEVNAYLDSKGKKDINASSKYGSLVFDAEAETGQRSEVQTNLQPGQYIALAGQGEGPPKLRTSFTVTTAKSPAALPAPQATIRTIEFGFRGPSTLHAGELVRFENEGFLVHMDVALQVKNMKAAKQVVKLLLAGKERQIGKLAVGGTAFAGPVSPGAYQQETITAKPGVYVQACFMNSQDGREHTRLGMERIIKIVK